jgi:acyl-CoA thioesterase
MVDPADARYPDPLSGLLGFELEDSGAGRARVRATVAPEHCNMHGTVHGGFVFALADTALAIASNSHGPVALALVASIHFTRAVRPGAALVAEAREVSLTRSSAVYEVEVRGEDGETVALFTGTVHRRAGPDGRSPAG